MAQNVKNAAEIALSKQMGHLVFTETQYDEIGIQTSQKRAILQIAPDYDPEEVLEKAKEFTWEIYGEADNNGFYKARRVEAAAK
jgi:hypothetical protein